jgi:dolichol-phosphate mannosyltransferase
MLAFAVAYAQDMAGRGNALRCALLAATLPFCFGIGVMITPDAPLAAAWAAALFFLQRALLGESKAGLARRRAGDRHRHARQVLDGAGAGAAFVFMLVDARSRRSLLSAWAWGGVLVALLVFSPVIVWNLQHDWASFAFQGSRRLAARAPQFSLPEFLAAALLLLTPLGVLALWRWLRPRGGISSTFQAVPANDEPSLLAGRRRLFMQVFTLLPLLVFAVSSLRAETKFHWTGPIWLAILPVLAATMSRPGLGEGSARSPARPRLDAAAAGAAADLCLRPVLLPGLGAGRAARFTTPTWRWAGATCADRCRASRRQCCGKPAAVPPSSASTSTTPPTRWPFYDPRGDGARDTASRHLFFNENAVMYEFWFPRSAFAGRDLIAVSGWRGNLEDPRLPAMATRLGPVQVLTARKGGVAVATYYARVVYGYRPAPLPQ